MSYAQSQSSSSRVIAHVASRYTPDGPSHYDRALDTQHEERAPQPHRGLPIAFVRSCLFAVSGVGDMLDDAPLPVGPMPALEKGQKAPASLKYSGPRLGQQHSMVWQALMTIAIDDGNKCLPRDVEIKTNRRALLEALGWKSSSSAARKWLMHLLKDIQRGLLEVETARHTFRDTLISSLSLENKTGQMTIKIPARAFALLSDEIVVLDLKRKRALGRDPLTLWLHDFVSSQRNDGDQCITWPISRLHTLSGSTVPLFKFRAALKKSANTLSLGDCPLLRKWRIDEADRLVYTKTHTRVVILPPKAHEVAKIQNFHSEAVTAAQRQRERVLL